MGIFKQLTHGKGADSAVGEGPQDQDLIAQKTPRGVELLRVARLRPDFDEARQAAFLEALAEVPNLARAACRAGVMLSQVQAQIENDAPFAECVEMAKAVASGVAEEEAFRRAVHGRLKGIYYQGMKMADEVEYSDQLMVKTLEANDPKFQPKSKQDANINLNFSWLDLVKSVKEIRGNSV